jgi:imidazolonepropionase
MQVDLIVTNIGQLITCASPDGHKRGKEMADVGIIEHAAVAIKDGVFAGVGTADEIERDHQSEQVIDAGNSVVCPGFVDPHTHIVFAGDRLDEFELKIEGADYLEILANGGGIISTVRNTRAASFEELVRLGIERLDKMLACGTTTCEIKTGYGLDLETEVKMLEVIAAIDLAHDIDIVPTFLAAHAVPPEYKDNVNGYVELICDEMMPAAWLWYEQSHFKRENVPVFADVFCEKNAFDLDQTRRIFERALELGFALKAHVDEFTNLGGSELMINLGATSIDHLDAISEKEVTMLSESETIGIITPTVNFNFGSADYAPARRLIDAGCSIALSTDYNPGSAPSPSQPMAMAIACRYQKLLPAEVMNSATINAAYSIGLGNRFGSIEVGKAADFLICDTRDYRQLAYEFGGNLIDRIFKAGHDVTPGRND